MSGRREKVARRALAPAMPGTMPPWWEHWLFGPGGRAWDWSFFTRWPRSVVAMRMLANLLPTIPAAWFAMAVAVSARWMRPALFGVAYLAIVLTVFACITPWERRRCWPSTATER